MKNQTILYETIITGIRDNLVQSLSSYFNYFKKNKIYKINNTIYLLNY